MKTLGFMRIKDESRWIERVLKSMATLCEQILILDDHSADGTQDICRQFPQVTLFDSPFEGIEETRDKNWLLEKLAEVAEPADTVLSIDGDEELAPGSQRIIRGISEAAFGPDTYRFHVLYLWDREDQIRVDGIYRDFWRPSMFRYRPGVQFRSNTPGGFHCGNVPDPIDIDRAPVDILHYGYLHREDRIRKWLWYSSIDPHNQAEGYDARYPMRKCYPHMVIGDVPEVPADARLKHGGPLQLEPLAVFAQ